jgi:putative spermidine/putrescine transport system permease protein
VAAVSRRALGTAASWVFLLAVLTYFLFPLLAMARFAFQRVPTILLGWSTLFDKWTLDALTQAFDDPQFGPALWLSVRLALGAIALTLALMLPTAMWVHLRLPKARGLVETLTILPYVVPPIALVVGVIGAYQDTISWFFNSRYSLIPFYAILAMPFTYRSLDAGLRAIDLRTLVDASRSCGAGWGTTTFRVLVPNLRVSLLSSAFLTATVVMGEFTMAALMGKRTLPTFTQAFYELEPQGGLALGLLTLVVTTALLAVVTFLTRRRGGAAVTAGV